jgi:hypothetical protein
LGQKSKQLLNTLCGDSGARAERWAIGAVGRRRGDTDDDAVAVLDFKRDGFARGTVTGDDVKGAAPEGVRGIDYRDGVARLLAAGAAGGIKKIPRLMAWRGCVSKHCNTIPLPARSSCFAIVRQRR